MCSLDKPVRFRRNPLGHEDLSPGEAEEIDRVGSAYPRLTDDALVAELRDEWLR